MSYMILVTNTNDYYYTNINTSLGLTANTFQSLIFVSSTNTTDTLDIISVNELSSPKRIQLEFNIPVQIIYSRSIVGKQYYTEQKLAYKLCNKGLENYVQFANTNYVFPEEINEHMFSTTLTFYFNTIIHHEAIVTIDPTVSTQVSVNTIEYPDSTKLININKYTYYYLPTNKLVYKITDTNGSCTYYDASIKTDIQITLPIGYYTSFRLLQLFCSYCFVAHFKDQSKYNSLSRNKSTCKIYYYNLSIDNSVDIQFTPNYEYKFQTSNGTFTANILEYFNNASMSNNHVYTVSYNPCIMNIPNGVINKNILPLFTTTLVDKSDKYMIVTKKGTQTILTPALLKLFNAKDTLTNLANTNTKLLFYANSSLIAFNNLMTYTYNNIVYNTDIFITDIHKLST